MISDLGGGMLSIDSQTLNGYETGVA